MTIAPKLSPPIIPCEKEINDITWIKNSFNPAWFPELGITPRSIIVIGDAEGNTAINYSQLFSAATIWVFEQNKARYKHVAEKLKKLQKFCIAPVLVDFTVGNTVQDKCITMDWLTTTFLFTDISLLHISCCTALAIPVIEGMTTLMPKLIYVNTRKEDEGYKTLQQLLEKKKYTRVLQDNNYQLFKHSIK